MKRARKVLSALFLAVAMVLLVFAFVACGEKSITGADIVNGELVLTYSDGTTDNLGSVVVRRSAVRRDGRRHGGGIEDRQGNTRRQRA